MERVQNALALMGSLTSAPTVAKTIDVFQQAIEPFGVTLYRSSVMGNPARMREEVVIASNWPEEWEAFYAGRRAFTFDPVVSAALKSDGFFWRELASDQGDDATELMASAREIGLIDGFTAVRSIHGASKTSINLAGENLDWSPVDQAVVTLLSNSLMSHMLYLKEVQITPAVDDLTKREIEILSHAAAGYHDKEIALELKLSHETIRFYWKTIRKKLGAKDRANAVAIALWSGKILP